ncbi:hypothetical protein G5603_06160 [Escherichia coli]|uniref:Uncharacterized protein n=1 Tax=Escherichia coli TaxID=562 RepID=A0A6M1D8A4_ECOLX|nr:hypothetical protein [Escherichia coli]NGE87777.1 hypothetical protein [Escherichia coli]HAI5386721.1 hypothetical protein [Escherichia coli]HAL9580124.1 hypothetical protein [Escherichia coli]HAO1140982.1 hypothetical protein [Escherichia coli]HBC0915135.1 hypothetical protein [Escherichia coli]
MPQFFNSSTPVTSYVAYLSGIVAPSFQLSVSGPGTQPTGHCTNRRRERHHGVQRRDNHQPDYSERIT